VGADCNDGRCERDGRLQLVPSSLELPSGSNKGNKGEDPNEEKFANEWLHNDTSAIT